MLDLEVKKSIRGKFEQHLDFDCKVEFYGTKIEAPDVRVNLGDECFFDHEKNSITIGLTHPTFAWCEDIDQEYANAIYVSGHEKQHRKSTTKKASIFAVKRGCEVIIEHLASKNGIPCRFVKDSDYDYALSELNKLGIKIRIDELQKLVHAVFNSVEDGRIERIRSQKNDAFRAIMKMIRLRGWNDFGIESVDMFGEADKMSAVAKCHLILNQILELATTGYYQKGFSLYYFGTEIQDLMNDIIPNIAKGVLSPTCKGCAEQSIIICEKIAEIIAEASKMSEFEQMMQSIIKNILEKLGQESESSDGGAASEAEEEEGDDDGTSPFENTDLFIELDDETYDKLKKQDEDNDEEDDEKSAAFKVHIKREHPLEEDSKPSEGQSPSDDDTEPEQSGGNEETDSQSSGTNIGEEGEDESSVGTNSQVSNEEDEFENSESGSGSESSNDEEAENEGDANNSGNNGTSSLSDEENDTSSPDSEGSDGSDNNGSKEKFKEDENPNELYGGGIGSESESDNESEEKSETSGKDEGAGKRDFTKKGNTNKQHNLSGRCNGNGKDLDEITKSVQEMMDEAAKEAAGLVEGIEANISNTLKCTCDMQTGEDIVEPLAPVDISDIQKEYRYNIDFEEMERSYEVDLPMPPILCMEIMKMQKQFEKYLRSKKAKKLKNRYSGSLDSERVGMLAANQIDCFKEEKTSKGTTAAAILMVDNSGSMGQGRESKREFANTALAKAEMTFAKFFPIKIFAYDECGAVIHEVIKNWGEKFSKSAAWNFLHKGRAGCGNMDGFSIRVATQDILRRPEKRKLMVILSDGLPDDTSDVHDAVDKARKAGIKVVAIYFSDYPDAGVEEMFREMYVKDYIITEPENIGEELIRNLKGFFLV